MNEEEIDIWLKHFADKPTSYQMFDENGMIKEINFFIVFRYLKELEEKVSQLEKGIHIEVGDYINGDKITNITKDMFIKGQIDIFTDKVIIGDFGDREVVGYRIRKGGFNE